MKITSSINLSSRSAALTSGLRGKLSRVVRKAALDVEAHAKASILGGEKTGRIYGTHQASAPGEAPANDLGALAGRITTEPDGELQQTVIASAEYAAGLELGTVRTAPRPFMLPAVEAVKEPFIRAVQKTVEKA